MFLYNISLLLIFWTIQQYVSFNFKTIYSFVDFKFNSYFVIVLTIVLFSIAGVPPFIGFFSKLLILINLINSNFFIFYIFFFSLLFFGLYFYIQNIRFLYSSSNNSTLNYAFNVNIRLATLFYFFSFFFLFFIIFGFFYLDDLILYFYWILS